MILSSIRRVTRGAAVGVGLLALSLGTVAATASSASAESAGLVCSGQSTTTYSPPLTNSASTVTAATEGHFGDQANPGACVHLGIGTPVTGGSYDDSVVVPNASCTNVNYTVPSGTGTRVFTWSDGTQSTFTFTTSITTVAGQAHVARIGTITAGRFMGASAVHEGIVPTLDAVACSGSGVESATSQNVITIL